MSDIDAKTKHSKRILQKENHVSRQMDIRKAHNFPDDEAHKYHKMSGTSCGDSDCVMCGNPRKFFKEKTMQEKSFEQTEGWDD
jgi:hypothetical protein